MKDRIKQITNKNIHCLHLFDNKKIKPYVGFRSEVKSTQFGSETFLLISAHSTATARNRLIKRLQKKGL